MTRDRFQQLEKLYEAVQQGTPAERETLLAAANSETRRELESLLTQRTGGELLDQPAVANHPELLGDATVTDSKLVQQLGPYRIEGKLGAGGMGEVFRAVDTRLGRPVAIKTTRLQFSARFEREARAISSLNHPHICTLYDVGPDYLVMELVEGETIAALLKRGPLAARTALLYASQIASALAEAHSKSVIHRDLKPGNIMIAKSGVKVLDFGLAKTGGDETLTASHMVMGTPAYMAPEQKAGQPADERSDIYAFGCVFYEMLTGTRVSAQRRRMPSRRLEKIISRCLADDPGGRWQTAAELERELAIASAGPVPWKAVAAGAAVVAMLAATYGYLQRPAKLTGQDTIVLADFDNKTGDPVFDDTLRQGLAVELQESPFSVISDRTVQQTLALMGQPNARLTSEIAQEVCERTSSAAVLEGSIARVGSQYLLGLRAKNCSTGSILDQQQVVAPTKEDVLHSLSQIGRTFRTRVGESLATVERNSTPLAEVTTPSLEALKAYSTGGKMAVTAGNEAAIPFYRRAVEIDPKFAIAHAHLGLSYSSVGESELSAESTARAWQLRDRVSPRERFYIDFSYDRQVTGNLEKAYQTLELWKQTYPRGGDIATAQGLLGGISTHGTGRYQIAIAAAQESIALDPSKAMVYGTLAAANFRSNRVQEAEATLQRAAERKLEIPHILVLRYNMAALKGDHEEMARVVSRAKGKRRAEHWLAHQEALTLARTGRLQGARRSSRRAVELALQEQFGRESAASYLASRGVWEAFSGNAPEGIKSARAALELSKGRDVEYAAGFALALSGDSSRSGELADDLEKRFPEDTFAKFTYVPVLRGLAALRRSQPAESVDLLEISRRYELAQNGLTFNGYYLGGLHSAYIRGEAFLAARRLAEAAAEFQKILDHRGLVALDPIGALAHLQLGRVFALSGDNTKAKAAYQQFLSLWKDADPDVPILKSVKAEYAKL